MLNFELAVYIEYAYSGTDVCVSPAQGLVLTG
jgi:hypothetical protein